MTNDAQKVTSQKRSRGRPKGSTKLEAADRAVLRKVARLWIEQSKPVFASLVKEVSDVDEKDVSRLRRRWKVEGQELCDQAIVERGRLENLSFIEQLGFGISWLSQMAEKMLDALPIGAIRDELGKVSERSAAYERLGLRPEPPFDVTDPEAVMRAIARFEAREFRVSEDLTDSFPPGMRSDELKKSNKLYSWALLFYGLYENAKREEEEAQ